MPMLTQLRQDHANMARLLHVLQLKHKTLADGERPNFRLIREVVDYILDYMSGFTIPLERICRERISAQELALFDVYQQMLGDAALGNEVEKRIREGQWAPGALADVVRRHTQYLERVDDGYLRERAADIRDLGRRVLAHLQEGSERTAST